MDCTILANSQSPLEDMSIIIATVIGTILGAAIVFLIKLYTAKLRKEAERTKLEQIRQDAVSEAAKIKAQAEADAKSKFIEQREIFDKETAHTKRELRQEEKRLAKRDENIDKKLEQISSKERQVSNSQKALEEREKSLQRKDVQLNALIDDQKNKILQVAKLTQDEARKIALEQVEKDIELEAAKMVERKLDDAREESEIRSREIILQAIQRYAAEHTCDHTVAAVDIPSDDMKGRVIGREGRNIRAFEKATGVDVIVDDTPGVVVCSAFDPVRREVARRSLERLIQDGRIHPTRIEEVVSNVQKEMNKEIAAAGKNALLEANVQSIHPKLVELLGRLQFRTSYGQNVLKHSLEVAYLSQVIADQLGLNGKIARRAGLLHDIGKAVDHEVEGGHPQIGADLLRRYKEREEVINAAAAHHGDVEAISVYTPIVLAADAISASRPGARRESLERYVQRLEKLEGIATAFEGVKGAYAIQAGREVRVIVDPENIDDRMTQKIAHDIAKQIEQEMEYPGEVRVTLIREVRCVDYAK